MRKPLFLTMLLTIISLFPFVGLEAQEIEVTQIYIENGSILNLLEGETVQLTAKIIPENATNKSVTWSSSNTNVATVSETGLVTAISGGNFYSSTITVTAANGISNSVRVRVKKVTVQMGFYEDCMQIGSSQQLSVEISPDTVSTGVVWTSSAPDILAVDSTGLVTVLKYGPEVYVITATIDNGMSATAEITIDPGIQVEIVDLEHRELTLNKNESDTIDVYLWPWAARDKRISVTSSNGQVVKVGDIVWCPDSASGLAYRFCIDAVGKGISDIKVSAERVDGAERYTVCQVTVNPLVYKVVFVDWDGTELYTQTVEEGAAATRPQNEPTRLDYLFTGWDKPFVNVTSDMTITAQYTLSADAQNRTHAVVHMTEAGTLKDYLTYETDFDRVDSLTVSGPFNGYDLAYIRSMEGLLKKLIYLDLRDIEIVNSDAIYYETPRERDGLGNPMSWTCFVLSNEIGESYRPNKIFYQDAICYRNNFTHAFREMSQLREIRLPDFLTDIGPGICDGCTSMSKVVLPDAPVSIGNRAFAGTVLTEMILPETVETIGDEAFAKANNWYSGNSMDASTSLKRIIAENVKTVGAGAFSCCWNLEYVDLGKNVTSYGEGCFEECAIRSFEFTDAITQIPALMFYNCAALETISIPEGVDLIDYDAFGNCHNLKTVKMTNSVTAIRDRAFYECWSLTDMQLSSNIKEIGSDVFYNNPWLNSIQAEDHIVYLGSIAYQADKDAIYNSGVKTISVKEGTVALANNLLNGCGLNSVTLPQSLLTLGEGSLAGNNFSTLDLPENLEIIGLDALSNCSELTSLTIPEKVKLIGSSAFSECNGLVRFTYNAVNADILDTYNKILDYDMVTGTDTIYVTNIVNSIVPSNVVRAKIGDSVKKIPNCLFNNCSNLGRFEMGQNVEEIGYFAFQSCSALASIDLSNVKHIGEGAFNGCSLQTVDLSSAETVGEGAFSEMQTLKSAKLSGEIKGGAFQGCAALSELEILPTVKCIGENAFADCYFLGQTDLSHVEYFGYGAFLNCQLLNTSSLAGAVEIGDYSFGRCSSFTAGDLKKVRSVGSGAFEDCALVTVDLSGADTIGYGAFRNNCQLISVKLNGGIDGYVFEGCRNLAKVEFGTEVRSIGTKVFSGCTSLPVYDNIRYAGTYAVEAADKNSTSYTIQEGTRWIGDEAFKGCESVVSISLPESLEYIGKSAFYGCESLESVIIPNGVTVIESGTFYNCSNLKSVTIPGSVKNIMSNAFRGCSLQHVYCHAIEAPHADWTDFFIIIVFDNIANTTLHIPEGSENSYLYQTPWDEFGFYAYLTDEDLDVYNKIDIVKEGSSKPVRAIKQIDANGNLLIVTPDGREFNIMGIKVK